MEKLNVNEAVFLRWAHANCDWQQLTYIADHDEYGRRYSPDHRWAKLFAEIRETIAFAQEEGAFAPEFLRSVNPESIAEVIWEDQAGEYLREAIPPLPESAEVEQLPHRLFSYARIGGKQKFVTFDCVGLSIKDEPGMREFHHMISGVKTIVQAVLGKACRVVEVRSIQ